MVQLLTFPHFPDVAQMLRENHGDRFMIYNLSERAYDYEKFNNQVNLVLAFFQPYQVHEWCGFPDHHAPPLMKLFTIVRSLYSWLAADKQGVVVVHCLAGKGRTGTIIACLFLWTGIFNNKQWKENPM